MKNMLLLSTVLLLAGCEASAPDPSGNVVRETQIEPSVSSNPPKFALGDSVYVGNGERIGIVVNVERQPVRTDHVWVYQVMFQNSIIWYVEEKVTLVEKFDWNRVPRPGVYD